MKMSDWLRAGNEPAFGTVEQWIVDQLGRAGAEEEASYALADEQGGRAGVRILVATDIGLYDAFWVRAKDPATRRLNGTLHLWRDVRGLQLAAETGAEPSLRRREPAWSLRAEVPPLAIDDAVDGDALLGFWSACRKSIEQAR
jgi:hypothetical protein